ncbi:hypothetical protein AYO21_08674 [Fonsecaea monophora]|uniref:Ketoreductase domain-containing protein n=1 Tax=Fonsecaea monophora TaxID=254056 RepID=A0A177F1Q3_9EURO|nr:hypothetical protein AYO21_08674 [Fonsecaea monophora]OAG37139.1 hypothetical protein AYO21_08674 [Fonsecaea monophora]
MSQLKNFGGLFRLDGKVAVITGGSRGIGLHTATAFLQAGAARVILVARKMDGPQGLSSALEALHATIPDSRGRIVAIPCDLSQFSEVQRLAKEIGAIAPKIHILVANAGATWGGPLDTTPDASITKVLDLNVRSIINLARLLSPLLIKGGCPEDPARIIIVGAIAGFTVPFTGENSTLVYSVSKAAAHHLARNLAMEYGPRNVACNCVAPGFFPTKLSNGLIDIVGGVDAMAASNPLKRIGRPEDIAGTMVFLCSQAGSFVNGVVLPLDGGNFLQTGLFTKL